MTKFEVVSDLHLEHFGKSGKEGFEYLESIFSKANAPTLLVAGDIGNLHVKSSLKYMDYFFDLVRSTYDNVVCILGNHDYYGWSIDDELAVDEYRLRYASDNVRFLSLGNKPSSVRIEDTVVIGGTLWSNLDPLHELLIVQGLNDFKCIKDLTYFGYRLKFVKELIALRALLNEHKKEKCLVLTHHAPTFQTSKVYASNPIKSAFCSSLENLILNSPQLKAWVFGHLHLPARFEIGNCKLVENSLGYYDSANLNYKPALFEI